MIETRANRILVVQGRLDAGVIQEEQANLRNIAQRAGVELTFANPLSGRSTKRWDKPDALLHEYGGSMLLGSSDFDLDKPTDMRERYLNRAMPLAQKILDEGEFAMGICMGHQAFAAAAGERVLEIIDKQEIGTVELSLTQQGQEDPLFTGIEHPQIKMIYGHNNSIEEKPRGFTRLGRTDRDPNSALRKDNVLTFQGHPEIVDADELKARVALSKGTSHEYRKTHPIMDPDLTQTIVINFFNQVKQRRR
jgi:GMP synthase-like glutamine amidotransferase